jgi:hypothetical protein
MNVGSAEQTPEHQAPVLDSELVTTGLNRGASVGNAANELVVQSGDRRAGLQTLCHSMNHDQSGDAGC